MTDQTPLLSDEQIEWDMTIVEGDQPLKFLAMFQTMSPWKVRELYEAYRQALLSVVQELVAYAQHYEDCGLNADRRSYAYAKGCSCGLSDLEDKIKSTYNISPKP